MKHKTLTQAINEAYAQGGLIGVCATCVDKGELPFHWLPDRPSYKGQIEVRHPIFQGYKNYSHGYCLQHYADMKKTIDEYIQKHVKLS